jgi:hypothetical protein
MEMSIGPEHQEFTFVADYEELQGYTAAEALAKTGGVFRQGHRLLVVIFPLENRPLIPANARGVIQAISRIDAKHSQDVAFYVLPLDELASAPAASRSLSDNALVTYTWELYQHNHLICDKLVNEHVRADPPRVSALQYLGDLNRDWNSLGYSMVITNDLKEPKQSFELRTLNGTVVPVPNVGARAFLIENLRLSSMSSFIVLDFSDLNSRMPDLMLAE